ncbi:hypothetical protein [Dialister hominis]
MTLIQLFAAVIALFICHRRDAFGIMGIRWQAAVMEMSKNTPLIFYYI